MIGGKNIWEISGRKQRIIYVCPIFQVNIGYLPGSWCLLIEQLENRIVYTVRFVTDRIV